jgi:hypothetical protein
LPASAKAKINAPPSAAQEASLATKITTKVIPMITPEQAVRNSETTCRFIPEGHSENAQVKITR